ncbi:MAG TPA: PEP-CTERM sorting domain-containing protein [Verrucomicrobiae bacterium]|nr:PEP-CTERM sorting domain-containing protein [Verrucomicrobiae bacterium]
MKLVRVLLFALVAAYAWLPVLAQDDVTFLNSDGTFTGTGQSSGTLSLGGSTLVSIMGFTGSMAGYDVTDGNIGTLTFTTGNLEYTTGCGSATCATTMVPLGNGVIGTGSTNETSVFGPGGAFKVVDTYNGGFGGFTFSGQFSAASWSCAVGASCHLVNGFTNEWKGTWSFTGTLTNVMITIDGQQLAVNSGPITIQSTTVKDVVVTMQNGQITFTDAGGQTNFSGNFAVSPEPGTLALFGSGLIAVGLFTRRKLGSRPENTSH